MSHLITDLDQLTPKRLTEILRKNGALERGDVTGITYTLHPRTIDVNVDGYILAHLFLTYSADASLQAPRRLFFKLKRVVDRCVGKEVYFYKTITVNVPDLPVLQCYDAVIDDNTGCCHLLLEDVSETHFTPLPPTQWQPEFDRSSAENIVDGYAKIHAYYWNNEARWNKLNDAIDGQFYVSEAYIHTYSSTSDEELAEFFDYRKNELNGQQRRWFEQAADQLPGLLIERLSNRKHLTIGHQDANTWNILRPRNSSDNVRIIDWEGYHLWFGADDITAPFVRFQPPELRQAWEIALLQRYHNRLLEYGVEGYDWDDLWDDYRLSTLYWFCGRIGVPDETRIPIADWVLANNLRAFEELHCEKLL